MVSAGEDRDERRDPFGASGRQIAANRENAQRSTGPISEEGKAKSSRNAVTNGVWAKKPIAIARGNFAEDADEVDRYLMGIVDALAPRDALQDAQALNVATSYLRLRRLRLFESEALSGVGRPRRGSLVRDAAERMARCYALEVADWIVGVQEAEELDFERVVTMLMDELGLPIEDTSRIMLAESEWDQVGFQRIAKAMLDEKFPDETDAVLWAIHVAARHELALDDAVAMREREARNAVRDDLDRGARVHERVNRQLYRALGAYLRLVGEGPV